MVSRSNASKVIDIQDKIRTADGLSFNEPLKFTAKSSTIRSDKKRRGTKFNYLRIWIDRKSSIKISMMLFPETCGIALWNRDTLLRYGVSVVHISFRILNQMYCGQSWIRRHDLRILPHFSIIKFLNLSFRIPRIYFRIEYILLVFVNFWYLKFYFIFFFHIVPYCSSFSIFLWLSIVPTVDNSFLCLWVDFWNFHWNLLLFFFFFCSEKVILCTVSLLLPFFFNILFCIYLYCNILFFSCLCLLFFLYISEILLSLEDWIFL